MFIYFLIVYVCCSYTESGSRRRGARGKNGGRGESGGGESEVRGE